MNELLEKLSTYNIFNFLLPGILFAVIGDVVTSYELVQKDIVVGVFLYYFIGLVISRVGSLIVEPTFKALDIVKFEPYSDYIEASQKDEKILTFNEENNVFRTMIALFLLLIGLIGLEALLGIYPGLSDWVLPATLIALLILFSFAYRKETAYITKRIKKALGTDQ